MSFDVASFALGMIAMTAAIILYAAIAEALTRREQWNKVIFDSPRNPSQEWWGQMAEEREEDDLGEEAWVRVIPASSEPESSKTPETWH